MAQQLLFLALVPTAVQGANIGIAVRGKEGCQAVQACDIAISQFRFLVPLLHLHGRRAYRRVGMFLCFFIYKHVVLVIGDLIWAHFIQLYLIMLLS